PLREPPGGVRRSHEEPEPLRGPVVRHATPPKSPPQASELQLNEETTATSRYRSAPLQRMTNSGEPKASAQPASMTPSTQVGPQTCAGTTGRRTAAPTRAPV